MLHSLILALPTILHVVLGFGSVALIVFLALSERKGSGALTERRSEARRHPVVPELSETGQKLDSGSEPVEGPAADAQPPGQIAHVRPEQAA